MSASASASDPPKDLNDVEDQVLSMAQRLFEFRQWAQSQAAEDKEDQFQWDGIHAILADGESALRNCYRQLGQFGGPRCFRGPR